VSRIHWTRQASGDLDEIHEYVKRDSPAAATALVVRLLTAIDQLEAYPQSGRAVPEFDNPTIRELIRGSYRIVYRLWQRDIQLLRIHHAARPLPQDLTSSAG
jgi:toxin ParE1/3/4